MAQPLISAGRIAKRLLGDKAYDSADLRRWLSQRGTKGIIPNRSNRKRPFRFSKAAYRERHRIENAFCRLKDFRRIAARYDGVCPELPGIGLFGGHHRLVDFMSLDPNMWMPCTELSKHTLIAS